MTEQMNENGVSTAGKRMQGQFRSLLLCGETILRTVFPAER